MSTHTDTPESLAKEQRCLDFFRSLVGDEPMTDAQLFRRIQQARESVKEAPTPFTVGIAAALPALEAEGVRRGLPAKYGY